MEQEAKQAAQARAAKPTRQPSAKRPAPSAEEPVRGMSGKCKGVLFLCASICVFIGSIVMCLAILYTQAAVAPGSNKPGNDPSIIVQTDPSTGQPIENQEKPTEPLVESEDGIYNILIVGTDGDGTRTDTIMIANLNTAKHTVALLSVPRDTFVQSTYPKINGVYGAAGMGEKGINALEAKLKETLGFWVDGYVIVDLEAFVEIVDLVGGVDFNVPMNMYYNDPTQNLYINLKKGWQHLSGAQAIQLCRFRKGYANADIGRTAVQQDFMKALASRCLETVSLSMIPEYAELISKYVRTDLTIGNMVFFGQELMKCNFDDMYTVTLPGEAGNYHGASVWVLWPNATLEIINEHFNPYDRPLTASDISIRTMSGITDGNVTEIEPIPISSSTEDPTEPNTDGTKPIGSESADPTEPTEPTDDTTESGSDTESGSEPTEGTAEPSSEQTEPTDAPTPDGPPEEG